MNYTNRKWRKKRAHVLMRDKYKCQECLRYGRTKDADTVHHIYVANKYEQLRYMSWNLVSLCNLCHNKMHNRDNNELTEQGKQWQQIIRREYKAYYRSKRAEGETNEETN